MILQMVKNERVGFGRHVNIQVGYKIIQLEVLKETPILHNAPCFDRGCFEAVLMKNTPRTLGVKHQPQKATRPYSM
jgi:hypothetical protein